jgi:DNA repair photolyase
MAGKNLVRVAISITTLDRRLARSMEPRAATPEKRLSAVKALSEAGVPVIVMFAPAIPALNDHEMETVLERAAEAGAVGAGYVSLRLPMEIADLFQEWLATDHPDRAKHVMSLVRQMRGGKTYDSQWGKRMKGEGPLAALMSRRFKTAKARLGLDAPLPPMDLAQFSIPPASGGQMDLFG